jgi:hypothetical protein
MMITLGRPYLEVLSYVVISPIRVFQEGGKSSLIVHPACVHDVLSGTEIKLFEDRVAVWMFQLSFDSITQCNYDWLWIDVSSFAKVTDRARPQICYRCSEPGQGMPYSKEDKINKAW